MPTDEDKAAGHLAVTQLGVEQMVVDDCLAAVTQAEVNGNKTTLLDMLKERRVLSDEQANELRAAAAPKEKQVKLGDFVLLQKLGEGGMGAVYKARQESMDRLVALKVLPKHLAKNADLLERFYREARAGAKLDHPNVVRSLAVGKDETTNVHYFAMELIDGQTVKGILAEKGKLAVPDAVRIALDTLSALEHAHSRGLIHRDVKPDNILVTREGVVKLADLGLVKLTEGGAQVTQSGHGFGTPYYMPPEQAHSAKYADARSDIYAMGATLYHMLTGQVPYSGETTVEILKAKESGQHQPSRRFNDRVPERLDLVLDKMMHRDPAVRYASCAEVIADLEKLNLGGGILSWAKGSLVRPAGARPAGAAPAAGRPGSGTKTRPAPSGGLAVGGPRPGTAAAPTQNMWHLRYTERGGKLTHTTVSSEDLIGLMRSGKVGFDAQASRSPNGPFRPLKDIKEFGQFMTARLMKASASKQSSLAQQFADLDKAETRRKKWRKFKDVAKRYVTWLIVLGVLGGGGWYVWKNVLHEKLPGMSQAGTPAADGTPQQK